VIRKTILKDKLMSETQYGYARRECTIHSQLKHENVVELYDYTEGKSEFVLLMEYCNDANYFQEKIEEVRTQYNLVYRDLLRLRIRGSCSRLLAICCKDSTTYTPAASSIAT